MSMTTLGWHFYESYRIDDDDDDDGNAALIIET